MAKMTKSGFRAAALVATLALGACGGEGLFPKTTGVGGYSNNGGHAGGGGSGQGRYQVGKTYTISGMTFTPREDYGYSAVGIASWYGEKYHGRRTANGEVYDMYRLTAAHPTLPLPSVVRVTNLENGRQLDLRVNDRGPFIPGRIIDVSKVAADRLGFKNAGVAQVRVDILPGESKRLKQAMLAQRRGGSNVAALAAPAQPTAAPAPSKRFEFRQISSRPAGGSIYQASASTPQVATAPTGTPARAPTPPPLSAEPLPPVMPHASAPPVRSERLQAERAVVDPRALADATPAPIQPAPQPAPVASASPADQLAAVESEWVIETLPLEPVAVAPTPPPAPLVASAPTPIQPAASSARPGVYVQAGAFGDAGKAEQIRNLLATIGPALVEPVSSGGRSLYRVRVGPFNDRGAAASTREQVAAAGFPDALTIAK